jgi:Arc/MetJ-type ribon-helix-helix transcriptional regulator
VWYPLRMTITLTPEQLKRLQEAVAAGHFASVEEAVRLAVDQLVITAAATSHGADRARTAGLICLLTAL